MNYKVNHETVYNYPGDVSISHNLAHLSARDCARQTRLFSELEFSVAPAVTVAQRDAFGNPVTFFAIQQPHRRLCVRAVNLVQVYPLPAPDTASSLPWEQVRVQLRTDRDRASLDACQFTFGSTHVKLEPWQAEYAALSFPPGRPLLEAVSNLTGRIHADFKFDTSVTTTGTSLTEVFALRRGVCQDFAHFEIACLRSMGLAARYVSGYLLTVPPPGRPRLIGADASHAWLSVYCPGPGWVDFDPTNNRIPSTEHITLAWGRDYDDVSPIKGVILGGGRHSLTVAVDVVSLDESDGLRSGPSS
jgi:transglutaminase-like putative cysteine protease